MTDLDYEIREKKRISYGARNRKRGSKSKKCSLPSDHMTKKQWKEKCGEMIQYNLTKPMTWKTFCAIPPEQQKEYLLNLINTYGASARDISRMMGVSPSNFSGYCSKSQFQIDFRSLRKGRKTGHDPLRPFIEKEEPCVVPEPNTEEAVQEPVKEIKEEPAVISPQYEPEVVSTEEKERQSGMALSHVQLSFRGPFDLDHVYNSLRCIILDGTPVELDICCRFCDGA